MKYKNAIENTSLISVRMNGTGIT